MIPVISSSIPSHAARRPGRVACALLFAACLVATLAGRDDVSASDARPASSSTDAAGDVAAPAPTIKPTPTGPRRGWLPDALRTADELAQKIAASSVGCSDHTRTEFAPMSAVLEERGLPVPAAVTQCQARDEEDLTFDVFVDERQKEAFVAGKVALLCKAAASSRMKVYFLHVDGPGWIIEPDDDETADELARLLGATARRRPCP